MIARYERPAILSRISPDRHAVIEASAGTGKTYTLEHLVIERILQGTPIQNILVVTFTEKAATEMRERIRKRLIRLRAMPEDEGQEIPLERAWLLDGAARRRVEEGLRDFDSASISTIHAFCQRILGELAFANHRLFSEKTAESRTLFREAFVDALRTDLATRENRALLEKWLSLRGVDALEDLLRSSSTERARRFPAGDEGALSEVLDWIPEGDDVLEALRAEAKELGRGGRPVVDRAERVLEILRQIPKDGDLLEKLEGIWKIQAGRTSDKRWLDTLEEGLEALSHRGPLTSRLLEIARLLQTRISTFESLVVEKFLPHVEGRLKERKRREGLLDFDDMLLSLRESLRGPGGAALAALLRERYRYVLIDEFQDTDEVQWDIFRSVFFLSNGEAEGERGHVLYVIGDPKQAIYQFRGADVETYLAAKEEILREGGDRVVLEECFRATPALIEGYNRILDQRAPFFSGEIRYDNPVRCGKEEMRLSFPSGGEPTPIHLFTMETETLGREVVLPPLGRRIAREIRSILDPQSPSLLLDEGKGPRRLEAKDIFILYRASAEGAWIGEALREQGIPFAFYKQDRLFQTEEAWAWHDVLAAIAQPADENLLLKAWMSPFFGVPLEELPRLRRLPSDSPPLRSLLGWKAEADERRFDRLFPRVLDESGVIRRALFVGDERGMTNLLHLSEILQEKAQRSRCTVADLVPWLRALIEERAAPEREGGGEQRLETERAAVQLMTLHASKGLEAAVVFIVGGYNASPRRNPLHLFHRDRERCVWVGNPPRHVQEAVAREALGEDERLLYVGLTRAKARLYLPVLRGKEVMGGYRPLNRRLIDLLDQGGLPATVEEIPLEPEDGAGAAPSTQRWRLPEPEVEEAIPYDGLRDERRGFEITSYSKMRGSRGVVDWEEGRVEGEQVVAHPGEDELPGGPATGIFLHEILARIPPREVSASYEDFHGHPAIRSIFEEEARRHGIRGPHLEHAWRLVHRALHTKIPLGAGGFLEGIVSADRWLPEMEFLYPIPEGCHPPLGSLPPEDGFRVRRGFVKGFIDLIFEKDGFVYFADWKSDCLPSFHPSYLRGYVDRSYEIQARLYSLAVIKLLGIRDETEYEARFGGLYYFFLRGMGEGEGGLYFRKPSWSEVMGWERELVEGGSR